MAGRLFPLAALSDLADGQEADFFALLSAKSEAATRDGKPYWRVTFRDAGREVSFPLWSDSAFTAACKDEWKVGEEQIGRQLGVEWHAFGDGFTWDSDDLAHDIAHARQGWEAAKALIESGEYRLVVLDELTYLCTWGWVATGDVVATIAGRPENVNVVITGRDAPAEIVEIADTVTEMRLVKHHYRAGVPAQRGIED